jgi:hypothetical protein
MADSEIIAETCEYCTAQIRIALAKTDDDPDEMLKAF